MSRREPIRRAGGLLAAPALAACGATRGPAPERLAAPVPEPGERLAPGRANGDRFTHLLAFSPGFLIPARPIGAPAIFVSHGVADEVLPIDRCSRRLVPVLRPQGYRVRHREFEGRHEVPAAIAHQRLAWSLDRSGAPDPA